ncbi:hypothetical protein B0H16DRAFT_1522008 [Mycena metata]|uniref:Uncharacterized protein n=1 Tax=Mycena metata TaxID=1033252 RepID=A0AAD7JK91_9AGAR|nr:hypothetical protein B0H16DRAFT_1522008 [Mycena metata]
MWLPFWGRHSASRRTWAPLLLFASSSAREWLRDGRGPSAPRFILLTDLAQAVVPFVFYLLAKKTSLGNHDSRYALLERGKGEGTHAPATENSAGEGIIPTRSRRFYLLGGLIGLLFAIQAFADEESAKIKNLTELHVMLPVCSLVLLVYLRLAFGRPVVENLWASLALQFCGLYMAKSTVSARFSQTLIPTVTIFAVASSLAFIIIYYVLRRLERSSVNLAKFALVVFLAKFAIASMIVLTAGFSSTGMVKTGGLDLPGALLFVSECCKSICLLITLDGHDVILVSVLLSFSNVFWLATSALLAHLSSFGVLGGCAIAAAGSYLYVQQVPSDDKVAEESFKPRRFFGLTSLLLLVGFVSSVYRPRQQNEPPPSVSQLLRFEALHPSCHPRKTPASLRPLWESEYHEFDNVLLIVFFSHARYDVNLDFYKEVYSKYFPNMVFLGPQNRQDAGFNHSFDVVVNSYYSDEDMSVWKMAGRMAHHMLYQAMVENDCGYDGYLWAPFDTFLNVPRLQQFDKSRFWYHSPWGEFVPNTASTLHAPVASISPDPYPENPEDVHKYEWWWGSKEYGLSVCMPVFEKIPQRLRDRLAEFNDGKMRLVGGSSDTVYIPGKHAKAFRETLGMFLETTCFLEIATPTSLHLVAPRDEPILFLDHWWIWQEPLSVEFVRNQWAKDTEVDTFHTFHWGDPGADGVWRAHEGVRENVRKVLAESAARQGIDWK